MRIAKPPGSGIDFPCGFPYNRGMKVPWVLTSVLPVLLIGLMAGGALLILRGMHDRAAAEASAELVLNRGRTMVSHLLSQAPAPSDPHPDWSRFSHVVQNLHAVEHGLQYVSMVRDGMVVFHEQTVPPDAGVDGVPPDALPEGIEDIIMRRELLQSGSNRIPVVVFSANLTGEDIPMRVEAALRKDTVSRENRIAGAAISSMFRLSLLTIWVAFAICMLMVGYMLHREMRHARFRAEQEHLAFSGMLANGIVHDFRNPMSSIKLDAQLLEREVARGIESRPDRIAALAGRLRGTLDRMDEIFKAFLFVSRPDRAERADVCAVSCVRDAIGMLEPRIERAGVRTDIRADMTIPATVRVFVASWRRALVNVLTNAIDFSPAGGIITIRISRSGHTVTLDIHDQGPGIAPADRKRVFGMFVTTRPEGTGLGLFLARTAIERSGGTIAILDPPADGGTVVRITLPAA